MRIARRDKQEERRRKESEGEGEKGRKQRRETTRDYKKTEE